MDVPCTPGSARPTNRPVGSKNESLFPGIPVVGRLGKKKIGNESLGEIVRWKDHAHNTHTHHKNVYLARISLKPTTTTSSSSSSYYY